jgi:predicted transcriptional regulator
VVARLRERRWSTTRIAEAIGVSDETVRQDLSGSENSEPESPARIDRLGGGTYPSSLPGVLEPLGAK